MSDNPFGNPSPFGPSGGGGGGGDDNPFGDEPNPFADPATQDAGAPEPAPSAATLEADPGPPAAGTFFKPSAASKAGTRGGKPAGSPGIGSKGGVSSFGSGVPTSSSGAGSSSGGADADLRRREDALARREEALRRREDELRSRGGGKVRNWPRCYPLMYHDIEGEIPVEHQRMVKHNYWAFIGLCLCLSWNFMGVTMAWGAGALEDDSAASWFLSALYLVCGVPLGFILWYLRLYHATQKDSALTYAGYFLFKLIHVVFSGWAAVGPPIMAYDGQAFVGFMPMVTFAFEHSTWLGVIYIIGASMWVIETLISFWNIKLVYCRFRSSGGADRLKEEAEQARNQAARSAAGF